MRARKYELITKTTNLNTIKILKDAWGVHEGIESRQIETERRSMGSYRQESELNQGEQKHLINRTNLRVNY